VPAVDEVFALATSTPDGSFAHGRALLSGGVRAGAELRRGFDLSAEAQLEGQISGTIGDQLVGSLEAAGEVGTGVVLQAQLPLDLFDPLGAGLVTRFRAQAAAAASVAASVGLTVEELQALVRPRVQGPLETLMDLFLAEVEIKAGVWARAARGRGLWRGTGGRGAAAVLVGWRRFLRRGPLRRGPRRGYWLGVRRQCWHPRPGCAGGAAHGRLWRRALGAD
jgi:hypothetical protein